MLFVLFGLSVFGVITSTVFAGLVLFTVPRFFRERREAEAAVAERPGFTPPLSLLKPLHGVDPGMEAYLESFYRQDYPEYEILFCSREADDAGLKMAREVAARHPEIPTKFIVTEGKPDYPSDKVTSLERMEAEAAYDILVVSDSDVRVTPEYLRAVALAFREPHVGAMCCLYRGVSAEGGLWARLEAVGMSVEMSAGVLVARAMEGMQFTLGPTMAFRRETVRRMGGFAVTAEFYSDDFVLGNEVHKLGETVVLSHHAIDHMVINSSLISSLAHQIRWMRSTRFSRPKGHFGTSLTFAMPFGLLGLVSGWMLNYPVWGVELLVVAVLSRLAISLSVGRGVVRDPSWLAVLVLYPVRDLLGFCFWASSYVGKHMLWRGREYVLLPGGRMRLVR